MMTDAVQTTQNAFDDVDSGLPPSTRREYGQYDYTAAGAVNRWAPLQAALRAAASIFNGSGVLNIVGGAWQDEEGSSTMVGDLEDGNFDGGNYGGFFDPRAVGGVRPGDNGILQTNNMYYGIMRASLSPNGITPGQTYLAQWAGTPTRYDGDAPLELQPAVNRPAPWTNLWNPGG
jgi:hypothetical protein